MVPRLPLTPPPLLSGCRNSRWSPTEAVLLVARRIDSAQANWVASDHLAALHAHVQLVAAHVHADDAAAAQPGVTS